MKKFIYLFLLLLIVLSSIKCAMGSATAGYALHANTADNLSQKAIIQIKEQLKSEIKNEILIELKGQAK